MDSQIDAHGKKLTENSQNVTTVADVNAQRAHKDSQKNHVDPQWIRVVLQL